MALHSLTNPSTRAATSGNEPQRSVLGAGKPAMPIAAMSAAQCGNVRVGLEDFLWVGPGPSAHSIAVGLKRMRKIPEGLGLAIPAAGKAHKLLKFKGCNKVRF